MPSAMVVARHGVRPGREQVGVGGVVHHVDRAGARRAGADLAEHHLAVGLAVPLHVGEPVPEAEDPQHGGAELPAALQPGRVQVAQRHRDRADPLVRLGQQRARVVLADVLLAPAPAGGLTTSGKPACWAKSAASAAERASRYLAHGTPAARSTVFIWALSRKLPAVTTSMPAMPRCSRTCARGTCSCSRTASSRCTGPSCSPSPCTAPAIWPTSSPSSIRQCPARLSLQPGRQAVRGLAGDQRQLHVRQRCRGLHEPRRRVEQIGRDEPGDHHGKNVPSYHSRHERRLRRAVLPG